MDIVNINGEVIYTVADEPSIVSLSVEVEPDLPNLIDDATLGGVLRHLLTRVDRAAAERDRKADPDRTFTLSVQTRTVPR